MSLVRWTLCCENYVSMIGDLYFKFFSIYFDILFLNPSKPFFAIRPHPHQFFHMCLAFHSDQFFIIQLDPLLNSIQSTFGLFPVLLIIKIHVLSLHCLFLIMIEVHFLCLSCLFVCLLCVRVSFESRFKRKETTRRRQKSLIFFTFPLVFVFCLSVCESHSVILFWGFSLKG